MYVTVLKMLAIAPGLISLSIRGLSSLKVKVASCFRVRVPLVIGEMVVVNMSVSVFNRIEVKPLSEEHVSDNPITTLTINW